MRPGLMPDLQEAIELSRLWIDLEFPTVEPEEQRMVYSILLAYIDVLEKEVSRLRESPPEVTTYSAAAPANNE